MAKYLLRHNVEPLAFLYGNIEGIKDTLMANALSDRFVGEMRTLFTSLYSFYDEYGWDESIINMTRRDRDDYIEGKVVFWDSLTTSLEIVMLFLALPIYCKFLCGIFTTFCVHLQLLTLMSVVERQRL